MQDKQVWIVNRQVGKGFTYKIMLHLSRSVRPLTLSAHAREGYSSHFVCHSCHSLASYPGPFTRAVRAGREIRAWYQSFAHA